MNVRLAPAPPPPPPPYLSVSRCGWAAQRSSCPHPASPGPGLTLSINTGQYPGQWGSGSGRIRNFLAIQIRVTSFRSGKP
jgi:hypothetical protein